MSGALSQAGYSTPQQPGAGYVQSPRIAVYCGTDLMQGCVMVRAENNNWYAGDRFEASFALGADPVHTIAWWDQAMAAVPPVQLDIRFSLDGGKSVTPMILGSVDNIDIDLEANVIHVDGRDLTSVFQEAKTAESFRNQTSSEIAQTLAARHYMTADADPTTTKVGHYYQTDHDHLTGGQFARTQTEWDLLTYLAQREGYDLYVSGTVLYFKMPVPIGQSPFTVSWTPGAPGSPPVSNVMRPQLRRAGLLARDVEVWVTSWHAKGGQRFTAKARAIGAKSANPATAANQVGTATQRYVYMFPNMDLAQAQAKANALLADISRHERVLTFEVPGDLSLTPRSVIQVQGTQSGFDQAFFIDKISRSISFQEGFRMSVSAKNHDTRSAVAPENESPPTQNAPARNYGSDPLGTYLSAPPGSPLD